VIIPTFDDGPDLPFSPPDPVFGAGAWTNAMLQFFDTNNMHFDFFMNTDNWCPLTGAASDNSTCVAAVVDILKLHNPGSHTVHHVHMGGNLAPDPTSGLPQSCDGATSMDTCDSEIQGVESIINKYSNGGRPHLTRFRPPYGEPYQVQGPGLADVEMVVAKYAVWIGWAIDSGDSVYSSSNCSTMPCPTGQQVANTVESAIGTPGTGTAYGMVLFHTPFPWTRDALPILFGTNGYLAMHGFRVGTVEDAICWKYGKHSWEIVQQLTSQAHGPN
jgi:peptidoglycan/xylan/chitin deacetylase (PgdA/CDA1 family)